jgi:L-threonylcarbamoyladenylate synthase
MIWLWFAGIGAFNEPESQHCISFFVHQAQAYEVSSGSLPVFLQTCCIFVVYLIMATDIRDIAYKLRQGHLIALADETGWSIAADPVNDQAVEQLLTLLEYMPAGLQPTVLIHSADQLGLYVVKLPEIAYDLVDFTEIPLTVLYEQGKNLSTVLWQSRETTTGTSGQPTGEVAVRRVLSPDIQRLISSFGRGVLSIPLESLNLPPAIDALVAERMGSLPGMPKRPRIMRLAANGEINFIRK